MANLGFPLRPGFRNVAAISKVIMANGDFLAGIQGNTFFASPTGTATADCSSPQNAGTLTQCVSLAVAGDRIYMAPGRYDESVTIAATKTNLTIVGLGNRDSVYIQPSTTNANGLDVRADDFTMVNVRVAGQSTSSTFGLSVYGSRFRAYQCSFHTAAIAVIVGRGTTAQVTAATHGIAADVYFEECRVYDAIRGIDLVSSDGGAVTRFRANYCFFHNLTTVAIRSNDVGASSNCVRSVAIDDCLFDNTDGGVAPTDYLLLNTTGDTGRVFRCSFMTTVFDTATITLVAGVLFVDNHAQAEGGLATGGTAGRPD